MWVSTCKCRLWLSSLLPDVHYKSSNKGFAGSIRRIFHNSYEIVFKWDVEFIAQRNIKDILIHIRRF